MTGTRRSKRDQRFLNGQIRRAQQNHDDDLAGEPPQDARTVMVQGQKFSQLHESREYENPQGAIRGMVNIPKRFGGYEYQEYSARLEYDSETKKYKFFVYAAEENRFHLFVTV